MHVYVETLTVANGIEQRYQCRCVMARKGSRDKGLDKMSRTTLGACTTHEYRQCHITKEHPDWRKFRNGHQDGLWWWLSSCTSNAKGSTEKCQLGIGDMIGFVQPAMQLGCPKFT